MMRRFVYCILVSALFCSFSYAAEYKAVDGDSLVLGEQRIRLDDIDAPEFTQICYDAANKEYPCGLQALQYLEDLMAQSTVHCDCLPQKDIYDREMCECFADGLSLNQAMVWSGYALTYRSEKYADVERSAKAGKRGIWQGKFMRPALYRALERLRQIPGE